jgi:hypothetical protein
MNMFFTQSALVAPVVATTYGFTDSDGNSQSVTIRDDGGISTTVSSGDQIVAACSIVSLCLMVTACVWMFFRYKKQRILIHEDAINKTIDERFQKVNERLANLETIALDKEKERKYDSL